MIFCESNTIPPHLRKAVSFLVIFDFFFHPFKKDGIVLYLFFFFFCPSVVLFGNRSTTCQYRPLPEHHSGLFADSVKKKTANQYSASLCLCSCLLFSKERMHRKGESKCLMYCIYNTKYPSQITLPPHHPLSC